MTKTERIQAIQEAREKIIEASDLINDAISDLQINNNYMAYSRYGIDTLLNMGNPYNDGLDELETYISKEL